MDGSWNISGNEYTEKDDVYSFDIILWDFFSEEPTYNKMNPKKLLKTLEMIFILDHLLTKVFQKIFGN